MKNAKKVIKDIKELRGEMNLYHINVEGLIFNKRGEIVKKEAKDER